MSRKSLVWLVMILVLPVLYGCPKKKPKAPVETLEVETAPIEEPRVTPPPPPPVEDDTERGLPADLAELNRVVFERGLIGDVFFDFDKSDLSEEGRRRLASNADFMRQYPQYQFTLEGHCDERGTNDYNLALGQRRANAAKDYLASLGIGAERMRTISYGEERPFCTQSDEGCWAQNRRAHFVITGTR